MREENLKKIEAEWVHYRRKYILSQVIFVSINLFVIIASALMIILNLFSLKFNDVFLEIKPFFIAMIAISGASTFCISFAAAFNFKSNRIKYEAQLEVLTKILDENNKDDLVNKIVEIEKFIKLEYE